MKTKLEELKISKSNAMIIAFALAVIVAALSGILIFVLVTGEIIELPPPPLGDFINVKDKGAIGDGKSDDSRAITVALNEAQTKGLDLYFPTGTYNLNNVNFTAKQNVRMYGDGESSILYLPGQITCNKNVSLENISIFKRTGVFVNLKPDAYSDVFVDNVKVYNDLAVADSLRFIYASITTRNTNTGVNNLTFTNNNISKAQMGLHLKCEVKSGLVDNNILTDFGDPNKYMSLYGLVTGTVDDNNLWVPATDVVISNNTIKGFYTPSPEDPSGKTLVYSILANGENISIINNHVENQNTWSGIYAKADNLLIAGNTLIDAGNVGSITVKVTNNQSMSPNIVIDNNDISTSIENKGAIRVHASAFTISNNKIRIVDNYDGILGSASAIENSTTTAAKNVVIEGNDIYSEAKFGAVYITNVDGKLVIKGNKITHNIINPQVNPSVMRIESATASAVFDCTDNIITIQNGLYVAYAGSSSVKDGSVFNFTNNTVTAPENSDYLISMRSMTCNLEGNTINLGPNARNSGEQKGILTTVNTSLRSNIKNNDIYYSGNTATTFFVLRSPFTMSDNRILFEPESNVLSIVNYSATVNAVPGMVSNIAKNIVGNATNLSNGNSVCNAEYFVLFNTGSSAGAYPQVNIGENMAMVSLRLLGRSNTGRIIDSVGGINVSGNLVYSPVFNVDNAIIDSQKLKEPNLSLIANTSLADHVAFLIAEAERIAREEADRLAAEAEKLAAEQAAAEAAAKAAEEEAARLAAEAAEAARLAEEAEAAAKAAAEAEAAEAARLAAEAEAAAKAAAEEAARIAAEQKAAEEAEAAARAEAEEAARIAAEQEAARLAAEEAEREAAERAAAAEEEERLAAAEAERLAREEAERIAAEIAAQEAAEAAALKALLEEAARIAAEAEAAARAAEENAKQIIPVNLNDFTYFATKDGYLVLLFPAEVRGQNDKCVTIDGKTYKTSQYDKNSIIVDVKVSTGQLANRFNVTAKVTYPKEASPTTVRTITKTLSK